MARDYLASHGINLDQVLSSEQNGWVDQSTLNYTTRAISKITGARLPKKPQGTLWDVSISDGCISNIEPHDSAAAQKLSHISSVLDARGDLLAPSLCHAHVHLDKCFLLDDPKYAHLEIVKGDFDEAMSITGQAKARFEEEDLLRRGRTLIKQSIDAGVTAMRAFVEVDTVVQMKCVDAGLKLKEDFRDFCDVQICAFAQLPVFSGDDGLKNRMLIEEALEKPGVDVLGSTPYVEKGRANEEKNIEWAIETAIAKGKLLDFHLDYNLDGESESLLWKVVEQLRRKHWDTNKFVSLGHCTRLTLFDKTDWERFREYVGWFQISFIGLPTSDLFMMGRPRYDEAHRPRGTLQVLDLIKANFNAAISMNNIGNAFTPQGSCDPLTLATLGIAIYHSGTTEDANLLYETVSSRAKEAIGCAPLRLDLTVHSLSGRRPSPADLVLLQCPSIAAACRFAPPRRMTMFKGRVIEKRGADRGS